MPVPADLTPSQFFETYLPAEWVRARADKPPAADATFEVILDGDGGGTWTIAVRGGVLATTAAAATSTPDLRVKMTTQDFRAAMQGEAGAPDLFPHEVDLGSALSRIPAGAAPTAPKGSVEIHIPNFNGRTWAIGLATGGVSGPTATVSVDADTILAIKHGTIDPASAFFSGKIQLGGDVAWIMQAGMGFMQGGRRGPLN